MCGRRIRVYGEKANSLELELVVHLGSSDGSVGVRVQQLQCIFATIWQEASWHLAGIFRVFMLEPDWEAIAYKTMSFHGNMGAGHTHRV